MKPKRIILVRHGESEGNADKYNYETIPDHALNLTDIGKEQALKAGQEIKKIIGDSSVYAYVSPYHRTRQTYLGINAHIKENLILAIEDPRIREQDWGHLRHPDENAEIIKERKDYSPFYFRLPDGESGADVYDRVSTFLETLHRDFNKKEYPENTLIVTHGMTLRVFLMRWFHWSVEDFHNLKNPDNCQVVVMEQNQNGQYKLKQALKTRKPSGDPINSSSALDKL